MHKLECYKALIQTDLVALSALKAFNQCLDLDYISAVSKVDAYYISSLNINKLKLTDYLKSSLFFYNPIKETLRFKKIKSDLKKSVFVSITEKAPPTSSPLENHLQTHFNDPSINVEESRLWQLTFKDSFHLTSDDILEKLVYSKNSNNGLLANPILQKAQIVS